MYQVFGVARGVVKRSLERDRSSEPRVEAVSRYLWPWQESRLLAFVSLLAALDYISTYSALELSGNANVYEGGLLAGWALQMGGFGGLFLVDIVAVGTLLLTAVTIRFLYSKFGFKGFGRTALVVLLVPYFVATMSAVFKNIALTFI